MVRAIAAISRLAAVLSSAILVYVTVHTIAEIALRTLFNRPTNVGVEFAGYGLAAMTYLALSDAMRAGSLVRVNVLLNVMPAGIRRALDAFCVLNALLITIFLAWYVWFDMRRSYVREFQTESIVPLPAWLPPTALLVGLIVFAVDPVLHLVLILRGEAAIVGGDGE